MHWHHGADFGGREKIRGSHFRMKFFRKKSQCPAIFSVLDSEIWYITYMTPPFLDQKSRFQTKNIPPWHHFLVSSYFASHLITVGLLLKILGGRMHGPSPHLGFCAPSLQSPPKSPPMVRWHEWGEVENIYIAYNFSHFFICLPKIITIDKNLTKFWHKQFCKVFSETRCTWRQT